MAVTIAISVAREQGRPPDALAYALAPTLAALALVRRRWPLAVLLASSAALFIYNQFDYPGLFSSVPLSVASTPARTRESSGPEGSRTPDLTRARGALYQLSYRPNLGTPC